MMKCSGNDTERNDKNAKGTSDDSDTDCEKDFATSTTCHGMSYWYTSEYKALKFFWVVLVLGMTGALVSQVALRIAAYFEYSTSTQIYEDFVTEIEFPSVTLCSFNRYFVREQNTSLLKAIHTLNQITSSSYAAFSKHNNISPNLTNVEILGNEFNITAFSDAYGFSINGSNMQECKFKSMRCTGDEFSTVFTSMGKCYTFNEGDAGKTQNIPGSGHGLKIVLNAQQSSYTEEPFVGFDEAGLRLQIHPRYEAPDVETYGLAVPVGHKVYMEVSRTDSNLMYKPWGECDPDNEKSLKYFTKYSLGNCMHECYTDEIISACGCRLFTQPWASDVSECTIAQMAECASAKLVELKEQFSSDHCGCSIPCTFTKYGVTIAYSTYPGKATLLSLQATTGLSSTVLKENAVELEIYFGSLSYHTFEQSKKIDESSLLSDIGGQLGLWVGMSLVTIFEFIQYFARKTCRCTKRMRVKRSRKTKVTQINA